MFTILLHLLEDGDIKTSNMKKLIVNKIVLMLIVMTIGLSTQAG
jgi:hypothetical protein